jgi:hypothetical protein
VPPWPDVPGAPGGPGGFGAPTAPTGPGAPTGPTAPSGPGALGTPGTGRRRRGDSPDDTGGFAVVRPRDGSGRPTPHPEHREHSAWGGSGGWAGQVLGRPGRMPAGPGPSLDPVEEWAEDWAPYDAATLMRSVRNGTTGSLPVAGGTGAGLPGLPPTRITTPGGRIPRPRQEFLDAFDAPAAPHPAHPAGTAHAEDRHPADPRPAPPHAADPAADLAADPAGGGPSAADRPGRGKTAASGGKGRTLSGVAAAAVVTVLAVVVAGQAAQDRHQPAKDTGAGADDNAPRADDGASRSQERTADPLPSATATATAAATSPVTAADYTRLMAQRFPLPADLSLSGAFTTVPGHQAAPGRGKVMRFRVDVEKGLPLDARLFSDAVFATLNDPRSWGHGGTMTFERVSSGPADIVITLASPGTTAKWCAKSGLDTTVDNVSCDAASTPRTMINAYRWAQGAATYGPDRMHAYRQMLINHEVGHRLGHDHVGCPRQGAPAPVMMQQTKFLSLDGGPTCKPNPWPFP